MSVIFVDEGRQAGFWRHKFLYYHLLLSYSNTIISASGAATVKGRPVNILTLRFNLKDCFSEMLNTEKPPTLRDSYSCKTRRFCCFCPSILYSHLPPAPPRQTAETYQTKFGHKSQPVWNPSPPSGKWERDEDRGSRVSQLQVVSRCGGSGDKPLWHGLGLPSLHFSSHCSTSCLSDRSHLAWQRERESGATAQSHPPKCGPCMPLGRDYKQIKCTHARTYTILHTPIPPWGCHMAINTEKLRTSCAPLR